MSKLEKKKEEFEIKEQELENIREEMESLALEELEQARKDNKPFNEIFELWFREETPKKDYGWLIHINVGAKDIWNYIDYGEPTRTKTYDIYEIVQYLEEAELTEDQLKEFKQQLMEQNVGSTVFDW